jgi:hypothetical protein
VNKCPKTGKTVFASKKLAEIFIKDHKHDMPKAPTRTYYCEACNGHHITKMEFSPKNSKEVTNVEFKKYLG